MIDLAPQHKIGLPLLKPVMIASGCAGYGPAYQRLLNLSAFGAIVTNPITLRPRRGAGVPRLAETKAGFVLDTGLQNPGVRKVIQRYGKIWARLGTAVIAHLPADEPDNLRRTAGALNSTGQVAAVELGVPHGAFPEELVRWIRAVREGCLLPLLVKLPLEITPELAEVAVATSVEALVVGVPPLASALSADSAKLVSGHLYGPALHSLTLHALRVIKDVVDLPLVAVGGIHSLSDARTLLQAGASTVQLDSLLFIDPKQAENIAQNLEPARAGD